MRYNLTNPQHVIAARSRLTYLVRKGRQVEIIEKHPGRTLNQNSYLHLLIGAFALEFGWRMEEAKLIYKKVNREIYFYTKKGIQFMRSSAELNVEEMAKSIDRFMEYSSAQGFDLPPAENEEWLSLISNEMEKQRRYL